MRFATAVLLLATAQPATAAAQPRWSPEAPTNRQVLPTFNHATVESVLDEVGARHERRVIGGRPGLLVTFAGGRRAALVFGACTDANNVCRALSIQSGWALPPGATSARAADAVAAFNGRYAFSRAFLLPNGSLALQRYLTADYGFVRGNLAVNLLTFAAQMDLFAEEVLAPLSRR